MTTSFIRTKLPDGAYRASATAALGVTPPCVPVSQVPVALPLRSGSVMLEFVIAFPLILTLMLACMQFAHMWMAKLVVHYAAYCAARAALVCASGEYQAAAKQAAEQVCAWIVIGSAPGAPDKRIPGWGAIPDSGGVGRKTTAQIQAEGRWNVRATVTFDFALIFPLVGPIIGYGMNPWQRGQEYVNQRADPTGNIGAADRVNYPHIRFTEVVVLPKPYVTVANTGLPSPGW